MLGIDEASLVLVGEQLPSIAAVEARAALSVGITWKDNTRPVTVVDLAPDIFTFKIYAPLRDDPKLFHSVHVINGGAALGWGAADEIDMPATAVERLDDEMGDRRLQGFSRTGEPDVGCSCRAVRH